MSAPGPESIPTSQDRRSHRPLKKRKVPTPTSPTSLQAATLSSLFANPTQEIKLPPPVDPSQTGGRKLPPPPEIVTNVQGSSAGAGSGEFHVYKAARRREYERLRLMDEEVAREKAREEFEKTKHEKETKDEQKTRKNRERRERQRKNAEMAALKKKQEEWSKAGSDVPGEGGNGSSGNVDAADGDKNEDANESADGKGKTEDAENTEPLATANSPANVSGPTPSGDDDDGKSTERQVSGNTDTKPASGKSTPAPAPAPVAQPGLLIIEDDDD